MFFFVNVSVCVCVKWEKTFLSLSLSLSLSHETVCCERNIWRNHLTLINIIIVIIICIYSLL